jgi:hypothetical protein
MAGARGVWGATSLGAAVMAIVSQVTLNVKKILTPVTRPLNDGPAARTVSVRPAAARHGGSDPRYGRTIGISAGVAATGTP